MVSTFQSAFNSMCKIVSWITRTLCFPDIQVRKGTLDHAITLWLDCIQNLSLPFHLKVPTVNKSTFYEWGYIPYPHDCVSLGIQWIYNGLRMRHKVHTRQYVWSSVPRWLPARTVQDILDFICQRSAACVWERETAAMCVSWHTTVICLA